MTSHHSLRKQLIRAIWMYMLALGLGVLGFSLVLHEQAEAVVWESLLSAEMSHFLDNNRYRGVAEWPATETLQLYRLDDSAPAVLRELTAGLHDELELEGRQSVVLVQEREGQRFALALDIDDLEAAEVTLGLGAVALGLLLMFGLGALMVFGLNRLFAPLLRVAGEISRLDPASGDRRIQLAAADSAETAAIAEAVNGLLQRNAALLEREREFLQTASHELHTPLTVISGALEVLQANPEDDARREQALRRIAQTAQQSMHLVTALMLLGEAPESLTKDAAPVDLGQLLTAQLEQISELTQERGLSFVAQETPQQAVPLTVPTQALELLVRQLLLHAARDAQGPVQIRCLNQELVIDLVDADLNAATIANNFRNSVHRNSGLSGLLSEELLKRLATHLGWRLQLGNDKDGSGQRRISLQLA